MIIRLVIFIGPPSVLDWLESFIGSSSEIPAREFYWPAECTCAIIGFIGPSSVDQMSLEFTGFRVVGYIQFRGVKYR